MSAGGGTRTKPFSPLSPPSRGELREPPTVAPPLRPMAPEGGGVAGEAADVGADRLPDAAEGGGRAGEGDCRKVAMGEGNGAEFAAVAVHEVHDPVGEAGLAQELQGQVRYQGGALGGL